jgi:hypothetical protein
MCYCTCAVSCCLCERVSVFLTANNTSDATGAFGGAVYATIGSSGANGTSVFMSNCTCINNFASALSCCGCLFCRSLMVRCVAWL